MDILCFMHEGSPYGYLKVNHKVILAPNLAAMTGLTLQDTEYCLKELHDAGVFDIEDGVICSRRMIRDENLRNIRALGGHKGGNPTLKVKREVNLADNLNNESKVKQKPTPSSSSSSSIINRPDSVPEQVWNDFLKIRKAKKSPLTQTALDGIEREADEAGWSLEAAITESVARGWQGFKADWVSKSKDSYQRAC
jgi:hypothetical protein